MTSVRVKTIQLSTPLKLPDNSEISIIRIRPPTVRDIVGLDFAAKNSVASGVTLLSRISGYEEAVLMNLSATDFTIISNHMYEMFMGRTIG